MRATDLHVHAGQQTHGASASPLVRRLLMWALLVNTAAHGSGEAELRSTGIPEGASGVTGSVTDEASGSGLAAWVDAWSTSGEWAGAAETGPNGLYSLALAPGPYWLSVRPPFWEHPDLLFELYDDVPCPGGVPSGCALEDGTVVVVQPDSVLSGIDFELGFGGRVTGRVRAGVDSSPLEGVQVAFFNEAGGLISTSTTDVAGRYTATGLHGPVFAIASSSGGYQPQLYNALPCPAATCDPTVGTPIPSSVGSTVGNVDFALSAPGAIAGTVVRSFDGSPIPGLEVNVWTSSGELVRLTATDADGEYFLGGLAGGSYHVTTGSLAYVDQVWPGLECEASCVPTDGTAVGVVDGEVAAGIDFSLVRWGVVTGQVVEAGSGLGLPHFQIQLYDVGGAWAAQTSGFDGQFEIPGLSPGSYYLKVSSFGHQAEVFDGIPCPGGNCDPTSGTPVEVVLDGDPAVVAIDLDALGEVTGIVTAASDSSPIHGAHVRLWDANGDLAGAGPASPNGTYRFSRLEPGTYYVTASHSDYLGALYLGIPCSPSCDPTTGTPVVVTLGSVQTGVDFSLDAKGSISGMVSAQTSQNPVTFGEVSVYDSGGAFVTSVQIDGVGGYRVTGLDAGQHYLIASGSGLSQALWDSLPCPVGGCNPLNGTPVGVSLGVETSGIDFELPDGAFLGGRVRALGDGVPSLSILLYRADGQVVGSDTTQSFGEYGFHVPAGTWFVRAFGGGSYLPQLYDGLPCSSCDVTTGTPITVGPGVVRNDVDFDLDPAIGIVGRVTDRAGNPLQDVAIDLWLTGGSYSTSALTSPDGYYRFEVPGWTYHVSTDNGFGALDEIWEDVPCPDGPAYLGLCDPTSGNTVILPTSGSLVTGVDFVLEQVPIFVDGFESGDTSAWSP